MMYVQLVRGTVREIKQSKKAIKKSALCSIHPNASTHMLSLHNKLVDIVNFPVISCLHIQCVASQQKGPGFEPNLGLFMWSLHVLHEFIPDAPGTSFHIKRHACKLPHSAVTLHCS